MNIIFRRRNDGWLFDEFRRRLLWASKPEIIRILLENGAEYAYFKYDRASHVYAVLANNIQCLEEKGWYEGEEEKTGWEDPSGCLTHELRLECNLSLEDFAERYNVDIISEIISESHEYIMKAIVPDSIAIDNPEIHEWHQEFVVAMSDDYVVLEANYDEVDEDWISSLAACYDLEIECVWGKRHWLVNSKIDERFSADWVGIKAWDEWKMYYEDLPRDEYQEGYSACLIEDEPLGTARIPDIRPPENIQIPKAVYNLEKEMLRLKKMCAGEPFEPISLRANYNPVEEFKATAGQRVCISDLRNMNSIQKELFFRKSDIVRAAEDKSFKLNVFEKPKT